QLGLIISISLILIAFEWTSSAGKLSELAGIDDVEYEEEVIPVTREEQNQPPPPPPPPQVTEVLNIVEDDVELEDELEIEDMEADTDTEIEFMEFEEEEEEEAEVFFIVEDMPTFMGGDQNEFRKYIQQNLKYPAVAAENGISGRVFVQFVVNEKGQVINAKVVRGVDPSLDKEALRVVMSSPKWTPGKQRGKPVRVAFTFPIVFVLQ
ncbi:energy transducer TonB, partial [Bacteroidota bacterium]